MVDLERSTQLTSGPEIRDVAANRSEYEPKPGLHYLSTDTGAEFIGDGNRWNKIQSTGANPSFRSVDTEDLDATSRGVSYVLYTDGAEISAIPQQNPNGPTLGTYTGETDIAALLTTLITDELPPQGTEKEAAGKILLKRGDYPGPTSLTMVPLPTSCWVAGESANHIRDDMTNASTPETEPPTRLNNVGFRPANVDGDDSTFPRVENLLMYGPGQTVTGSRAFDSEAGSNLWDWLVVENVVMQYYERLVNYKSGEFMKMKNCHGLWFSNIGVDIGGAGVDGRCKMMDCSWYTDADTQAARFNGQAFDCRFSTGADGGTPIVDLVNGGAYVQGGAVAVVGSPATPYGIRMSSNRNLVVGVSIQGSALDAAFDIQGSPWNTVAFVQFESDPATHYRLNGANDVQIWHSIPGSASVTLANSPARPRWNGAIGGGPFGGVDLSTVAPSEEGVVAMSDGTATGFPKFAEARRDTTNAQWVRVDGQATI